MHVCQVFSQPYPPTDGVTKYVQGLTRALAARGHTSTLFTRGPRTKRTATDIPGAELVEIRCPPIHPYHVHLQGVVFRDYLRKHPELDDAAFHVHSPYPPRPPHDRRYLLTVHTPMAADAASMRERNLHSFLQRAQARVVKGAEKRLIRSAQQITTVSQAVREELRDYGAEPDRIECIPNAVDERVFAPVPEPTRDYFLYAGRLGPRKGLEDLFDALEILARDGVRPAVWMTGRGPYADALRERAAKRGLTNVRFLGIVPEPDLPKLYAHARACLIPSHYEGLPTVLLESMASGTPVLATDIPGIREVVPQKQRPALVPPGAPDRLAQALRESLDMTKAECAEAGRAGRAVVEAEYTWPAIADRFEAHYRKITEARP